METGRSDGLNQDYSRGIHLWFASRLDARHTVRRWFGEQRVNMKTPITPQGLPPQTAEDYLRGRYGAYRGHFAWRELEEAFNGGLRAQAASVEPVGKIINSGGNTGSLPEHPAPSPAQAVDAVDAVDELREALRGLLASGGVIADASPDELQAALSDPESEPIVKTQAAAVLRARAALQASSQPQAQQAVAEGAGDGVRKSARDAFEAQAKDSFGFSKSARGTYRNTPVARDWKWFQAGIEHALKGNK